MVTTLTITAAIVTFVIWLLKRHYGKEDAKTPEQRHKEYERTIEDYYAKQDASKISVDVNDQLDALDRMSPNAGFNGTNKHSVNQTGSDVQSR